MNEDAAVKQRKALKTSTRSTEAEVKSFGDSIARSAKTVRTLGNKLLQAQKDFKDGERATRGLIEQHQEQRDATKASIQDLRARESVDIYDPTSSESYAAMLDDMYALTQRQQKALQGMMTSFKSVYRPVFMDTLRLNTEFATKFRAVVRPAFLKLEDALKATHDNLDWFKIESQAFWELSSTFSRATLQVDSSLAEQGTQFRLLEEEIRNATHEILSRSASGGSIGGSSPGDAAAEGPAPSRSASMSSIGGSSLGDAAADDMESRPSGQGVRNLPPVSSIEENSARPRSASMSSIGGSSLGDAAADDVEPRPSGERVRNLPPVSSIEENSAWPRSASMSSIGGSSLGDAAADDVAPRPSGERVRNLPPVSSIEENSARQAESPGEHRIQVIEKRWHAVQKAFMSSRGQRKIELKKYRAYVEDCRAQNKTISKTDQRKVREKAHKPEFKKGAEYANTFLMAMEVIENMGNEVKAFVTRSNVEEINRLKKQEAKDSENYEKQVNVAREAGEETLGIEIEQAVKRKESADAIAEEERVMKKKSFNAGKGMRAAKAGMDAANGVANALTAPFPFNWVQGTFALLVGAYQVGVVVSQPLPPGLAEGGIVSPAGNARDVEPFSMDDMPWAPTNTLSINIKSAEIHGDEGKRVFAKMIASQIQSARSHQSVS